MILLDIKGGTLSATVKGFDAASGLLVAAGGLVRLGGATYSWALAGQPLVAVSPVQQEPLVPVTPIKCGSLRRSTPITVGLPLKVNLGEL